MRRQPRTARTTRPSALQRARAAARLGDDAFPLEDTWPEFGLVEFECETDAVQPDSPPRWSPLLDPDSNLGGLFWDLSGDFPE